jgi:hypothetical protein
VQFQDIRNFQSLVGHYDAMTLQGGDTFKGAQYFKLVPACERHCPRIAHLPGSASHPR